jgi:hypothetical protein
MAIRLRNGLEGRHLLQLLQDLLGAFHSGVLSRPVDRAMLQCFVLPVAEAIDLGAQILV